MATRGSATEKWSIGWQSRRLLLQVQLITILPQMYIIELNLVQN